VPLCPPAEALRARVACGLLGAALLLATAVAAGADPAAAPSAPSSPAPSAAVASDAPAEPAARRAPPSASEIDAALKALRADPDLAGERTERTLQFKRDDPRKPRDTSSVERWLIEFFRWLGEAGRFLMWALGAIGIALLLWFIARALAERGGAGALRLDLPSHVGALDIRPDSLPDDVGAAAWDLWQRGDLRAALSLLYRGALSRLVHDFTVPIKAASTEGECVALAQQHAPATAATLFAELVGVWQLAVYGGRMPTANTVQRLCREFDAVLTARIAGAPAAAAAQAAP
jgi:hypothetical protein